MEALRTAETDWLLQQIEIKKMYVRGFLADIQLLNYYPENRGEFFNETLLYKEIRLQMADIQRLREELKRRNIP